MLDSVPRSGELGSVGPMSQGTWGWPRCQGHPSSAAANPSLLPITWEREDTLTHPKGATRGQGIPTEPSCGDQPEEPYLFIRLALICWGVGREVIAPLQPSQR